MLYLSQPTENYDSIEQEFEASLRRAFVDGKADYVVIHSRTQLFLAECSHYGRERGWLTEGELIDLDSQSSELRYRLTPEGKAHFNV